MKIDPHDFPIIIITAFVIGVILAFLLGFRPQHGSTGRGFLMQEMPGLAEEGIQFV